MNKTIASEAAREQGGYGVAATRHIPQTGKERAPPNVAIGKAQQVY
ncbi:MAG: hypothetical protein WA970_18555 [Gammaproteobacteria bacterium]